MLGVMSLAFRHIATESESYYHVELGNERNPLKTL